MIRLAYSEWGFGECRTALQALCKPSDRRQEVIESLMAEVRPLFAGRPLFAVNRGRTGLALALAAFRERQPERSEVLVPAYICPSVIETVRSLGLMVVPVDVGEDLNMDLADLPAAISRRTLAVVGAHMYGCPADIVAMEQLCRNEGIFLVDDAAQVVGVDVDQRPLGTFGDVGIVSFSQSKTIAVGAQNSGGLMIVNNQDLLERLQLEWRHLPPALNQFFDLCRFVWEYQWERLTDVPSYFAGEAIRRVFEIGTPLPSERCQMSSLVAALALEQFSTLKPRLAGRRRVISRFADRIAHRGVTLPQVGKGRYLARVLALLPHHVDREAIRSRLLAAGVQTRRGYDSFIPDIERPVKYARDVAPRLVELPSHSRMSDATIDRICEALSEALAAEARLSHQPITQRMPGVASLQASSSGTYSRLDDG